MTAYVQPATDQYSLVLVLFELLTGVAYRRLGAQEAQARLAALPRPVAALIERMTAGNPDERYPSVGAVRRDPGDRAVRCRRRARYRPARRGRPRDALWSGATDHRRAAARCANSLHYGDERHAAREPPSGAARRVRATSAEPCHGAAGRYRWPARRRDHRHRRATRRREPGRRTRATRPMCTSSASPAARSRR